MVAMSPIVEKRKIKSVEGRRVNGLHRVFFICSESLWLASVSSAKSSGFPLVNHS